MSIWFYLFVTVLLLFIILMIKNVLMKKEIENIGKSLSNILKSDTNNLITINFNDNNIKKLVNTLNQSLKELRKLELEYKNGNQELKSSITNISHDLRTPLTAIKCYLDFINETNLTKEQMKYFKIIDSKVKELITLTEQLFDFTRAQDGKIETTELVINDILEDSIVSFYGLFQKYQITPEIHICEEKVIRSLNENILKRIFENIISNAIKYSEKDFHITMHQNGVIEFSNLTNQLEPISLKKIFNRYYTVQTTKKSTGIGLSIAKQLVDLSGGTIEATYQNHYVMIKVKF